MDRELKNIIDFLKLLHYISDIKTLGIIMEKKILLHIEKLPEGCYLGTSDDIQGLIVQADTISDLLIIAKDVAEKLLEAQSNIKKNIPFIDDKFDLPLIVNM